jgi:hypothetical protein
MKFKLEDGTEIEAFSQEEFDAAVAKAQADKEKELEKAQSKLSKDDERWTSLNSELKELRKFQTAAEKEKEAREKALAAEQQKREEAELNAQQIVEKRTAEFQAQLDKMRQEQEAREALFAKERQFTELQMYRQQAVSSVQDQVEPRLLKYIGGNTVEEIDASVQQAIADTQEMFADIQAANTQGRAQMPGVRPGPPAITEMDNPASDGQVSAEDIKGMGWGDYAKFRQGRIPSTGQGIFG